MSETAEKREESFEQKLESVQKLIGQIESGTLPLEESVKRYEEGMSLLKKLDEELQDYSRRLTVLRTGPEVGDREVPREEPV